MARNDGATIREVYDIVERIETKLDKRINGLETNVLGLDKRLSNFEGKASILAIVWSSIVSMAGIFVGSFIKQH